MIDTAVSTPTRNAVSLSPLRIPEIQRDPLAFLQRSAAEHGDFIHYPLGLWKVYQLNHPDLIEHVLVTNQRNYSKNTVQYNTLSKITGRGLLTSDGRFWRRQRRMIQPAFHRQKVLGWGQAMLAATQKMLQKWQPLAQSGQPLDIDEEMMAVTLEIIGQALRLYPPAWVITRRAIAADTLLGEPIPAKAIIIMSPYTTHRPPQFWQKPDQFYPEHFLLEAEKARPRYAYFPFGGGPRLCIGDSFAKVEMGLVVTAVLQKYRLQLLPTHPVIADPLVTIRLKKGLIMSVHKR